MSIKQIAKRTIGQRLKAKTEYYTLLDKGNTQQVASKMVGITEKTGSIWAKQQRNKLSDLQTAKANIAQKLATITADATTSPTDINALAIALAIVCKQIDKPVKQ